MKEGAAEIDAAGYGAGLQPAFLDYDAVIAVIGFTVSKTTLWRWERDGRFPRRIRFGGKIIAWSAPDIRDWCQAQRAGRRYIAEAP